MTKTTDFLANSFLLHIDILITIENKFYYMLENLLYRIHFLKNFQKNAYEMFLETMNLSAFKIKCSEQPR